jgi:methylamine---glutamate N-methyltransferase subunit C
MSKFGPKEVTEEDGTVSYHCQCGKSANLPLCDGSHKKCQLTGDALKAHLLKIQKTATPAADGPAMVALEKGKEYFWCSCGRSASQPFCDGSHKGSEFLPFAFGAKNNGKFALCQCKKSGNLPFCDGSHRKLHAATGGNSWHRVAGVKELPDNSVKAMVVNGVKIALVHFRGEYSAMLNQCPHQGGPLADGEIHCDKSDRCWLVCPWHNWEFDPLTGKAPPGYSDQATMFPVEKRDDGIYVNVDASLSSPAPQAGKKTAKAASANDSIPANIGEEPDIDLIHALAEHGLEKFGKHGKSAAMGVPKSQLPSWHDIQWLPAQLADKPRAEDAVVDTTLTIGPAANQPLKLDIPLLVADMSFGALSREAKVALATGAERAGTAICSGEGGMLPAEQEANSRYMYELGSAMFGYTESLLTKIQAFHFKGGQSAKTGTGGHLPGSKITPEIAKVRNLKIASPAAISPPTFEHLRTVKDFRAFADNVRILSEGVPIGFKMSANRIEADLAFALEVGVDYLILDGRGGGTGSAPLIFRDHISIPTMAAIPRARKFLDEQGVKDVTLIATGGLRTPEDFLKVMALGADGVALATAAMQSIGCVGARICDTNRCPAGIATQDEALRAKLNKDTAPTGLYNFFTSSVELMKVMTRALGYGSFRELCPDNLTSWKAEIADLAGVRFGGIGRR